MGADLVKAAVFDVGGTLWFEAVPPAPGTIERLQAVPVQVMLDRWGVRLQEPLEGVLTEIWATYMEAWEVEEERGTNRDPSLPFIIRGALAVRDIDITELQADEWWRASWISAGLFGMQFYPDVFDVLRELREMGIRIGLNTNRPCTAEMFMGDLADIGLASYIDAVVTSGDTGFVKPHRSTFALTAERLGLQPHEIMHVGDSCARDCAGAKAAGMRTVWKLNGRYDLNPCAAADYTIHDLNELLTLPLFHRAPRPVATTESLTPHEDNNAERY